MVLSGSSGNIDISQSPVPCSTTRDLALRTQSGWLRSGTSQAKNRKATTTMTSPRAEPEQEAQGAVERADAAVEHHVGDPHGDDRHDQQGAEERAADHHRGGDDVVVEIGLRERQQLRIGVQRRAPRRSPRRRSTAPRA